jgi:hypothetical protein
LHFHVVWKLVGSAASLMALKTVRIAVLFITRENEARAAAALAVSLPVAACLKRLDQDIQRRLLTASILYGIRESTARLEAVEAVGVAILAFSAEFVARTAGGGAAVVHGPLRASL